MSRSLLLLACTVCVLLCAPALAAEPHHDLLRVPLDTPVASEWLRLHQNDYDIVYVKPGVEAHIAAKPGDEATLRAAGMAPELKQRDMEAAYAYPDKGVGFGVFHTYSESRAFMDSLTTQYPNLVSSRWSIGTTYQGNSIWAWRISDNPNANESEPEILFDGMHHAREIMASEFPIMFAKYLCEHYNTDPQIHWLVDNRELYIVPIMNPDGVIYNESTNPDGGGMWRKNRKPFSGQFGVDLNRNYPNHWGYDDVGSSPTPSSDTYRGPSAASERETQALINFVNTHEIITHNSIHTYQGMTLYPWGYVTSPTPDETAFAAIAAEMCRYNSYTPGQPGEILYDVNGGIFDTFYGTTTNHPAIWSFSTEIGTYGFWPPEANRVTEFNDNLYPQLYLMKIAGPYVVASTPVVTASPGVQAVNPGQSGTLSFTLENQSVVASVLNASVTVTSDDPWVQFQAAERNVGSIAARSSVTLAGNPIPFTVDAACPNGHQVLFRAMVHFAGADIEYPLAFQVGTPTLALSDTYEGGTANWTFTGTWGLTTSSSHSATHSLTDSPAGSYGNSINTSAQLIGARPMSRVRFWHKYATEANFDYANVQVSGNGGTSWTTVASYNGTLSTWTQVSIDLGAYVGQNLLLRFQLTSDSNTTADGWYIDDLEIEGAAAAFAMAKPLPISPVGGAVTGAQPELTVGNSAVPGGGAAVYGFRVYRDALCTDLAASADNLAEGVGQTAWTVPSLPSGNYWWRAWAGNGTNRTDLTAAQAFTVQAYVAGVSLGDALGLRVLGTAGASGSRFELTLPGRSEVKVDVFDARGARVCRVFDGSLEGGARTLVWDGRDGQGRAVASGVYFVHARVDERNLTGRVLIVR